MNSHDEAFTLKVDVKLVLVRVVVRDGKGHTVGNLHKDDFQLFDNRNPQLITQFSVDQPGAQATNERNASGASPNGSLPETVKPPTVPEHYVAYLFDDIHLGFRDLAQVRSAADRHLATLQATDRAAIFTTSGQTALDFTDDRTKLHDTLLLLRPRSVASSGVAECPVVSYYMADLIQNKNDERALEAATQDALACGFDNDPRMIHAARTMAQQVARSELSLGNAATRLALSALKDVIQRISTMPGTRTIILVSPGFFAPERQQDLTEIMDRAMRSSVIISALDARGLYAIGLNGDISEPGSPDIYAEMLKSQYKNQSALADADALAELADGTGGTFFHNNNNLEEGFRRVAATPEYSYVLGFSPQNLKYDGQFHSLKVQLKRPEKLTVQARRGYFAPSYVPDATEDAKRQIEGALFSQEQVHDFPVELHTQFSKSGEADAKLAVLVHVDVRSMHFRKVDGRHRDDLTVVAGLFDRNGNYIARNATVLQMRLRDEALDAKLASGVKLRTSFHVKPGSYRVRLVVRDTEGQLSAQNGAIEIP